MKRSHTPWKPTKAQLLAARDKLVPDLIAKDLIVLFAGINPGLSTMLLMPDIVFPVCSPALLKDGPLLASPADLLQCVLLHDANAEHDGSGCDWRHFLVQFRAPALLL